MYITNFALSKETHQLWTLFATTKPKSNLSNYNIYSLGNIKINKNL